MTGWLMTKRLWHIIIGTHRRTNKDGMRVGICNCGWRR